MIENPCTDCGGSGVNRKTVKIKVDIPAGVDTDSIVTVRGQGEPGLNGGPDGDLYIVVAVRTLRPDLVLLALGHGDSGAGLASVWKLRACV